MQNKKNVVCLLHHHLNIAPQQHVQLCTIFGPLGCNCPLKHVQLYTTWSSQHVQLFTIFGPLGCKASKPCVHQSFTLSSRIDKQHTAAFKEQPCYNHILYSNTNTNKNTNTSQIEIQIQNLCKFHFLTRTGPVNLLNEPS